LCKATSDFHEDGSLFFGFDALGDSFQAHLLAHRDERTCDCPIRRGLMDVPHKASVDLERRQRELLQRIQGSKTCSEIIDSNSNTELAQGLQCRHALAVIIQGNLFCQFELKKARGKVMFLECSTDALRKIGCLKLLRKKVHRHRKSRIGTIYGGANAASFIKGPPTDVECQNAPIKCR